MDAREFDRLADELAKGPSAAHYRTAVGRAYYAAFNHGADLLRGIGFRLARNAAAHGEVLHCLRNCGDTVGADAAADLNALHTWRNRADYQLDRTDVERPSTAAEAVRMSGQIIGRLQASLLGPSRAQIQAAIAKWRRENGYP